MPFSWTDFEDIAIALVEAYPDLEPLDVKFTDLREMVRQLDDFEPEPGQRPNEQILEAIQVAWHEEKEDRADAGDDDNPHYQPNNPYR